MPVIYIDVLFAVNLLINYIILRSCSMFVTLKQNKYRIIFGALIGAAYAVLIFFPDFSILYTAISKFLISMLIVAAAYPFFTVRSYIKTLLVFYLVSIGFGGCVLCVFYFSDVGAKLGAVYSNGIFYFNLPWTILLLSGILFCLSAKIFGIVSKKTYVSNNLKKKLLISYKNCTAEITALLDTGNSLIDPISLSPVIIAEYRMIKNLFPEDVRCGLESLEGNNIEWVMSDVTQKGLVTRIIPFSSLGKENGLLIGFVPDKVEIRDDCGVRVLDKCVIGLYNKPLSKDRSYGALLNPYL